MLKYKTSLAIGMVSAVLAACGGGGSSSSSEAASNPPIGGAPAPAPAPGAAPAPAPAPTVQTGRFVGTAVEGLSYESGSIKGLTGPNGEFQYETGKPVVFKLGATTLGTVTDEGFVTPISLVPGATDENNQVVQNIAVLLQSLDSDGNPRNGVQISEAVRTVATAKAVNLSLSSSLFAQDSAVLALLDAAGPIGQTVRTVISVFSALNELRSSTLGAVYEGTYVGTATGGIVNIGFSEPRAVLFTINQFGEISGNFTDESGQVVGLFSSRVSPSGRVSSGPSSFQFNGNLKRNGGTGTWGNGFYGTSGTWEVTRR